MGRQSSASSRARGDISLALRLWRLNSPSPPVRMASSAVNFVRQDQRQLVKWVQAHFQAAGKSIEPRLCEELIFLCGDLMQNLGQEV